MKLNYTSLQHAVQPVEEGDADATPTRRGCRSAGRSPCSPLHGQLAPLAWAFAQARPGARLGYVQTAGGALPGGHSCVVRELRDGGLLAGHLTAGPAFGGADGEAITTAAALHHGLTALGWDAAVAGPGPGILGSGSALGHGGLQALDSAHTALALGCPTLLVARMSSTRPARAPPRPEPPHAHGARAPARAGRRRDPRGGGAERGRRAPRPGARPRADLDGYLAERPADARRWAARTRCSSPPRSPPARALADDDERMSDKRIEPLGGETVFEGSQFTRPRRALPPRRRRGASSARSSAAGRRRRSSPTTTSTSGSCASRARRCCEYTLELPAGKLDVEGESPLQTAQRELAEEIGRRPTTGERPRVYTRPAATPTSSSTSSPRPACATCDVEADPGERIEIVRWPLADLDGALAATTDAKTLIGLQWLRATPR